MVFSVRPAHDLRLLCLLMHTHTSVQNSKRWYHKKTKNVLILPLSHNMSWQYPAQGYVCHMDMWLLYFIKVDVTIEVTSMIHKGRCENQSNNTDSHIC